MLRLNQNVFLKINYRKVKCYVYACHMLHFLVCMLCLICTRSTLEEQFIYYIVTIISTRKQIHATNKINVYL